MYILRFSDIYPPMSSNVSLPLVAPLLLQHVRNRVLIARRLSLGMNIIGAQFVAPLLPFSWSVVCWHAGQDKLPGLIRSLNCSHFLGLLCAGMQDETSYWDSVGRSAAH